MNRRLTISLIAFVLWTLITVAGGRVITGGHGELTDLVKNGIGWHFALAAGLLLAVARWQGWNDLKLGTTLQPRSLRLAWLPSIYIVSVLVIATALGLPPAPTVAFILVNTFLVGLSEELMFRGVLLQSLRHMMPVWPAVWLASLAFGAIHSLNVFTTGELMPALIQSCAAFCSGLIFIALRFRTGSLWPGIIVHALWDFATFMLVSVEKSEGVTASANPSTGLTLLLPILLVLPNAIYGLWLMRHIRESMKDPLN